jgi:hypothetical protein
MKPYMTLASLFTVILLTSNIAYAESNEGGDKFRVAASEYDQLSKQAKQNGDSKTATIFQRLAIIKRHAADLADQGRWSEIDWSEYHALSAQLSGK